MAMSDDLQRRERKTVVTGPQGMIRTEVRDEDKGLMTSEGDAKCLEFSGLGLDSLEDFNQAVSRSA